MEPAEASRLRVLAEFRYHLRHFLSFSETEAERFGIGTQQYQLLQVIGSLPPGRSASIRLLAERMVLRHNSTVELVDRAEKSGLVRRSSDERDGRRSLVLLTPSGAAVLERMVEAHFDKLRSELGENLLRALGAVRGLTTEELPTSIERVA